MTSLFRRPPQAVVGEDVVHADARAHVTGSALFTDDMVGRYTGVLHAYPVRSPYAHARIVDMDCASALAVRGVRKVLTGQDVPGLNDSGVWHDEPLFPTEVMFHGQAVAWVLGETREIARCGAQAVRVDYEPLPAVVTLEEALAQESFQGGELVMSRGDAEGALSRSVHRFRGVTDLGGQEHFYLETHVSFARVDEGGQLHLISSTQHPTETQEITAHVLGVPSHAVTVECVRMGGGFGGKEFQPHGYAALAALGATLTGRPVELRLDRSQDLSMTGKRHPFRAEWEAGFDEGGRITALVASLVADGGWSLDLSEPVLARALCHIDNAYFIPDVRVSGRIVRTNKTSQTAFRGFGGPQGMVVIEDIIGRCAPRLGLPAVELRRRNFYREGEQTPYRQTVRHPERMDVIWEQLLQSADFEARSAAVAEFNRTHRHRRRGIAVTPQKFGISFNFTPFNQAGALVHVYRDGSVMVTHGGTEMGQGLHTKMIQVAATALGVPASAVRLASTRTDKVPNTSATAASSGADLNGAAVKNACDQIRIRMAEVAVESLRARTVPAGALGVSPQDVCFENGAVFPAGHPELAVSFATVAGDAYLRRTKLWAAGFYRTPGLHWDKQTMTGEPFKYFSYAAACAEVEVDAFTGAHRVLRVDVLHDVGDSLSPVIDRGQIEGGFVQGMGWMTMEELVWDSSPGAGRGRLLTSGASTYKIPSMGELPEIFRVDFLERATETGVVYGSKAVGEPPLTLAISVREALRQACASFGPSGREQTLPLPATPEAVFWAAQEAAAAGSAEVAAARISCSSEVAPTGGEVGEDLRPSAQEVPVLR
ncbi:xanthine dehydrogenase, molybdenum binding subunit apoprotein [Austwickia chelonae]|uniref:Xanthine dehydrogenase molybdopterin-binding subunit n=1 Tax=Austwickia chelonae NBRC 105200 TaxID=1184607 RepID=K6VIQ7_9MICO|nr:xanthine dehydrogenase molybdopterin binding subunit [Austwickia chelonae]GAB76614.1 xanthine dehydrogenase molybdopterin-binding subunit [Austwickia chelonae NBRC 105200]SEW28038.1 xanthine dehydrogenase, molybdenum binding subunit apoprotein [Austwickia chelonae]